ncbi:L,D-transpeptidase family protein [Tunturiibacter empetritectus]|uniref:Murein L,D-transpeptidase YcbB/YkuD n=1 Tax=Tunturiibacter lichenicola TaxID=2051959 RepID=A0A852VJ25_9BACT|nr:murein L,D-transpeptidase YcbB/YkuD [Edaphobacter lichenicola]
MHPSRRLEIALLVLVSPLPIGGQISAQKTTSSPATATGEARSAAKQDSASARLSAIAASGHLEDLRWPDFSDYRSHVINFYRPGYQPAWIHDGQPTTQALELIQILQDADREGLQADDYDASRWADRVALLKSPHEAADEARFDAALTVCGMRYVSDLHIGRVNPQNLGFEFDVSSKKLDLPHFVRERLVNGSDLHAELAQIEPPFPSYKRLRAALLHYMELEKSGDGEKVLDVGGVSPGGQYAGIAGLGNRLRLLGDLPDSVSIPPDSKVYEGPLVDAVKHFQERLGRQATGELDYKTVVELNVPLSDRIEQMRLGLERYRWLPYQFKQPPIVINVPEFRLYGFDGKNEVGLTMRVNVGEDYDHQTPMFENNIQYLVFRPYWTPTPNILRKEIIPDLEKNPSLSDQNLELVSASGKVIKSGDVTPALLQQVRAGKLTVRQPPGPENGMGLVKFIFPNQHDVYIHDTPASLDMFSEATEGEEGELKRVASHGCIHVQDPAKFAAWLLRNNPSWNLEKVEKAMHDGRDNFQVNLVPAIPVLIFYMTVVVGENGDVHFFHDIYDHDRTLKLELAQGYPYPK